VRDECSLPLAVGERLGGSAVRSSRGAARCAVCLSVVGAGVHGSGSLGWHAERVVVLADQVELADEQGHATQ